MCRSSCTIAGNNNPQLRESNASASAGTTTAETTPLQTRHIYSDGSGAGRHKRPHKLIHTTTTSNKKLRLKEAAASIQTTNARSMPAQAGHICHPKEMQ